jgi:hypothetical protein
MQQDALMHQYEGGIFISAASPPSLSDILLQEYNTPTHELSGATVDGIPFDSMDLDHIYVAQSSDNINQEFGILFTEDTNEPATASATANPNTVAEEEGTNGDDTASPEVTASPAATDSSGEIFPCVHDGCQKNFTKAYLLNKHLRVHFPPHQCPYCPLKFAVTRDKNRHIGDRHRKEAGLLSSTLFCPVESCKRHQDAFGRKDNLLRHTKKQHKGNPGALAAAKAMEEVVALPYSPDGEEDVNEEQPLELLWGEG